LQQNRSKTEIETAKADFRSALKAGIPAGGLDVHSVPETVICTSDLVRGRWCEAAVLHAAQLNRWSSTQLGAALPPRGPPDPQQVFARQFP